MQVLDRTGVGTLWSICKAKFALAGHTHSSITDGTMTVYSMQNNEVNFGGSNNSATIYFGYRAKDSKPIPSNFVFGGSTGTATLTAAKFKGALEGNASTASNASTVNGHTVNANVPANAKFTDTNTWRGIQDNLTSTSTSESLSANQGKVLKGLVDSKANSSHTHTLGQITNAGAAAGKNIRTLNSVSHSSWSSASTDDLYVPTMSFIAYWNGAYSSSGSSNLQYCYKGKFGNLAVKDTADWSQVANKPATATRWPSWGEVTGKPELKSWSETKSYIDNKAASSGGVDSLPAGTLLRSYNSKNIFGDKWHLTDGSNVVTDQLPDLQDTVESNGNIIKETKQNVVEFNKYSLYHTRAACNFGGKFYVVNRTDSDAYSSANLFIIDENSCTSHSISTTPFEGQCSIQVSNEDIFIFVKLSDSLIVYYSKNEPNIKFTQIDLFASNIGIDTNDNTLDSFSMIGGGKAIVVYSPRGKYDSQIIFQVYNGKYQRITNEFNTRMYHGLGWLNGACYCTIDKSIYKISSDYNISKVFTGSNNITNLKLVFYSNYCIIVNYSTPIYYTKDFNTYTPYSGHYNYMDFNIYRSFVYMNGSNNESSGFENSSFIQKVNDQMLYISFDNSEYYIAIGLLVKNDNMYFLTMGQNFNTFRIYKMHIPIGSKVLPNMSDTYIKVK